MQRLSPRHLLAPVPGACFWLSQAPEAQEIPQGWGTGTSPKLPSAQPGQGSIASRKLLPGEANIASGGLYSLNRWGGSQIGQPEAASWGGRAVAVAFGKVKDTPPPPQSTNAHQHHFPECSFDCCFHRKNVLKHLFHPTVPMPSTPSARTHKWLDHKSELWEGSRWCYHSGNLEFAPLVFCASTPTWNQCPHLGSGFCKCSRYLAITSSPTPTPYP